MTNKIDEYIAGKIVQLSNLPVSPFPVDQHIQEKLEFLYHKICRLEEQLAALRRELNHDTKED